MRAPGSSFALARPRPALLTDPLHELLAIAPRDRIAHVHHERLPGERGAVRLTDLLDRHVWNDHRDDVAEVDRLLHRPGLRGWSEARDEVFEVLGMARGEHDGVASLDEQRPERAALTAGAHHADLHR